MFHDLTLPLNDLTITESISSIAPNSQITLQIQYQDYRKNVRREMNDNFISTDTIRDVIKKFLKTANLRDTLPEDVSLVEIGFGSQRLPAPLSCTHRTLFDLNIKQNSILYFEPSIIATIPRTSRLTIFGPDRIKRIETEWNETTTTLKMLVDFVIKTFSLQSTKREHIHLITISDDELDVMSHSDKLLSELGIIDGTWIFIQIAELDSTISIIHVDCAYKHGQLRFDIPYRTTIKDLKTQIEQRLKDYHLLDFKLFNRMHDEINSSIQHQMLGDLGIKPDQTMYASLRLEFTANHSSTLTTESDRTKRSTSFITENPSDEVDVVYYFSKSDLIGATVSVHNTVDEWIRKVQALKSLPSVQFHMSCGSIVITKDQSNRSLSSLGIEPGDIINVKRVESIPVHYTSNNNYLTTFSTMNELSRSQGVHSSPIGLSNLGNTCYMNSALQCLAHTKPLTRFFLDGLTQNTLDDDKCMDIEWNPFHTVGSITGAYAGLLRNLWLPDRTISYLSSFRPTQIRETIGFRAPRFATLDQQDAQEFMTFLLDEIHKEMKEKNDNGSPTIIEELFFGKIQSTITCLHCKHQVKTINPISLVPLPLIEPEYVFTIKFIAKTGESELTAVKVPGNSQVKHLIQAFMKPRLSYSFLRTIIAMTDDGPLDLEVSISQLSVKEVTLVEQDDYLNSYIDRFPPRESKKLSLIGCLQEFFSVESLEDSWLCQQETCKQHTEATKQLQFCTLPPILIIQLKRFSHQNGLREKIETFVDYPIDGLDLSSFLSSSEEAIYDLFAVTNHMGSIYGGHYIAFARHEINGENTWYRFDDSSVRSIYYKSDIVSTDAYLLFYMRREKAKQSTTSS